jgi:hypothetical protein
MCLFSVGKVCGLCGNADGNLDNDLTTSEGQLVTSESDLEVSWMVKGQDANRYKFSYKYEKFNFNCLTNDKNIFLKVN